MNAFKVATMTVKLLHRQQWFYTVLVFGIFTLTLAQLAGGLIPEENRRIVNETGSLGFLGLLVITASYWGSTLFAAGKPGGELEFQLAGPVTRGAWAVGRYLGMVLAIVLIAATLLAVWEVLLQVTQQVWATSRELIAFEFNLLNALLVATIAVFLSNFLKPFSAGILALVLWCVGMNTSVANYWNLQRLNPGARLSTDQLFTAEQLTSDTVYGCSMVLILLVSSCFIFSKRQ